MPRSTIGVGRQKKDDSWRCAGQPLSDFRGWVRDWLGPALSRKGRGENSGKPAQKAETQPPGWPIAVGSEPARTV